MLELFLDKERDGSVKAEDVPVDVSSFDVFFKFLELKRKDNDRYKYSNIHGPMIKHATIMASNGPPDNPSFTCSSKLVATFGIRGLKTIAVGCEEPEDINMVEVIETVFEGEGLEVASVEEVLLLIDADTMLVLLVLDDILFNLVARFYVQTFFLSKTETLTNKVVVGLGPDLNQRRTRFC